MWLCRVCVCEYIVTAGSVHVDISARIVFKPQKVSSYVGKEENKRVLLGLLKTDSFVFNCHLFSRLELHCTLESDDCISRPFYSLHLNC